MVFLSLPALSPSARLFSLMILIPGAIRTSSRAVTQGAWLILFVLGSCLNSTGCLGLPLSMLHGVFVREIHLIRWASSNPLERMLRLLIRQTVVTEAWSVRSLLVLLDHEGQGDVSYAWKTLVGILSASYDSPIIKRCACRGTFRVVSLFTCVV